MNLRATRLPGLQEFSHMGMSTYVGVDGALRCIVILRLSL